MQHFLLLCLILMEGVGKVFPSPRKELHIKPTATMVHLWQGPSQFRSQSSQAYPYWAGSGNKEDAKIILMDSSFLVSVQRSSVLCLAESGLQ